MIKYEAFLVGDLYHEPGNTTHSIEVIYEDGEFKLNAEEIISLLSSHTTYYLNQISE